MLSLHPKLSDDHGPTVHNSTTVAKTPRSTLVFQTTFVPREKRVTHRHHSRLSPPLSVYFEPEINSPPVLHALTRPFNLRRRRRPQPSETIINCGLLVSTNIGVAAHCPDQRQPRSNHAIITNGRSRRRRRMKKRRRGSHMAL